MAWTQDHKAGNITVLQRNGPNGTLIDNLTYSYAPGTNRLSTVTDAIAGSEPRGTRRRAASPTTRTETC